MSQEFCGAAPMRIRYGIMYFVIPGYDLIFDMKSWQAHTEVIPITGIFDHLTVMELFIPLERGRHTATF